MKMDYKKHPITSFVICLIIIVYGYTTLRYGLDMNALQGIEAGAFQPLYVMCFKEYYRLISANFIHFGIMHIFCNAYSLYNLGFIMEMILGRIRYIIVMIGSMLLTTGIPYLLFLFKGIGAYSVMAGISGVIFGLIGSLLALALFYKDVYMYLFKQIVPSLVFMFIISFAVPSISLVGHVSGMIGGFLMTVLIVKFYPLHQWQKQYHKQDQNLVN